MIELFAVAPHEDAAFLAAWAAEAPPGATLHRALRTDVPHRFASLASAAPDDAGGVLLIVGFDVPAGEDERFLAAWGHARELLAEQRGYLGTRLHRSLTPADFRFVNVARWSSPLAFSRAVGQPDFQQAARMPFASHPALYQVIRDSDD